jgi:hypothetical protein
MESRTVLFDTLPGPPSGAYWLLEPRDATGYWFVARDLG